MHGRGNRASGQNLAASGVRGVDSAWSQHPQGEPAQGTVPLPLGHTSFRRRRVVLGTPSHFTAESCLAGSLDTGREAGLQGMETIKRLILLTETFQSLRCADSIALQECATSGS